MTSQLAIYTNVFKLHKATYIAMLILGECMALWGKPNEPSIQH